MVNVVDSRCPKNVSCIRAGEAEVLVDIFKNGQFLKQQKLVFYASSTKKTMTTLYTSNTLNITGFRLLPYPIGTDKIDQKEYLLELLIED